MPQSGLQKRELWSNPEVDRDSAFCRTFRKKAVGPERDFAPPQAFCSAWLGVPMVTKVKTVKTNGWITSSTTLRSAETTVTAPTPVTTTVTSWVTDTSTDVRTTWTTECTWTYSTAPTLTYARTPTYCGTWGDPTLVTPTAGSGWQAPPPSYSASYEPSTLPTASAIVPYNPSSWVAKRDDYPTPAAFTTLADDTMTSSACGCFKFRISTTTSTSTTTNLQTKTQYFGAKRTTTTTDTVTKTIPRTTSTWVPSTTTMTSTLVDTLTTTPSTTIYAAMETPTAFYLHFMETQYAQITADHVTLTDSPAAASKFRFSGFTPNGTPRLVTEDGALAGDVNGDGIVFFAPASSNSTSTFGCRETGCRMDCEHSGQTVSYWWAERGAWAMNGWEFWWANEDALEDESGGDPGLKVAQPYMRPY